MSELEKVKIREKEREEVKWIESVNKRGRERQSKRREGGE